MSGYKSLAPIYFRNSNAAVIVYDITQVSLMVPCDPADNIATRGMHLDREAEFGANG